MELGTGLSYANPSRGLDMALRMQGLAAHAADDYGAWCVSRSLRLAPGVAGRGFTMSLTPSYGAAAAGSERLWRLPDASGLAADEYAAPTRRLDAELGYGLPVHGALFTGMPVVGLGLSDAAREVRLGWRLTPAGAAVGDVSLGIEAARRESAVDLEAEHRIGASLSARSPGVLCSALPTLLVAMRNAPAAAAPPRRSNATKAPSLFGFAVANRERSAGHEVVSTSCGSGLATPAAASCMRARARSGVP